MLRFSLSRSLDVLQAVANASRCKPKIPDEQKFCNDASGRCDFSVNIMSEREVKMCYLLIIRLLGIVNFDFLRFSESVKQLFSSSDFCNTTHTSHLLRRKLLSSEFSSSMPAGIHALK